MSAKFLSYEDLIEYNLYILFFQMGHGHFDVKKLIHSRFQHPSLFLSSFDGLEPNSFNYWRL